MEATKTRNIIMLGRSGSGKTTAQEVIKDITAQPKNVGLFSDTFGAKFASFSLDDKKASCKYTLNIIDTPGVQEVRKIGEDTRSDEAILETVKFCLKNEITKVHCLFIFVSFGGKINKSDKEAFKIYLEMFKHQTVRIGFCITRCEGMSSEEEESIKSDLMQDEYFQTVLQLPNVSTFYCGAVNSFIMKNCTTERQLTSHFRDIHRRREKLLRFIFDCEGDGVMLTDFPIVSTSVDSMNSRFDQVESILSNLESTDDFSAGPVRNRIIDFTQHVEYMRKNDGLFASPALYERFVNMKTKVRNLRGKMPEEVWISFSGQLIL